jgi:peptidoglycan/LPS O-acetylase OafA/YrhL
MFRIQDSASNNFDFLRLFCAVLVILSHSYTIATGTPADEPLVRVTHGYVAFGQIAVDVFFVISGYLVTASLMRSMSIWSYFRKRISRIYPGFIGATLFSLLFVGPLAAGSLQGTTVLSRAALVIFRTLFLSDLRWRGAFSGNPLRGDVNGSMWTIPFEFACYVMVAILGLCGVIRARRACLLLFAICCVAKIGFSIYVWKFNPAIRDEFVARGISFLPLFLAGAVGYLYRDRLEFRAPWAVVSLLTLGAVANLPYGLGCVFPLAGAYLVLFLVHSPQIHLNHFGRHGDFSYGVYLYAWPIQQLVVQRVGGPMKPLALFFLATPLTLAAAILSWFLIERRFLSRSRLQH